jgi:hypothetical protein
VNNHRMYRPKHLKVKLGEYYKVHSRGTGPYGRIGKLIKVTPKGFNLLDEETNQCLLSHHLYCKKWCNKPMPSTIPSEFQLTFNSSFVDIRKIK